MKKMDIEQVKLLVIAGHLNIFHVHEATITRTDQSNG